MAKTMKNLGNVLPDGKKVINRDTFESSYIRMLVNDVVDNLDFSNTDELQTAMKKRIKSLMECLKMLFNVNICKNAKDYLCAEWSAIIIHTGFEIMNYNAMKSGGIKYNAERIKALRQKYLKTD